MPPDPSAAVTRLTHTPVSDICSWFLGQRDILVFFLLHELTFLHRWWVLLIPLTSECLCSPGLRPQTSSNFILSCGFYCHLLTTSHFIFVDLTPSLNSRPVYPTVSSASPAEWLISISHSAKVMFIKMLGLNKERTGLASGGSIYTASEHLSFNLDQPVTSSSHLPSCPIQGTWIHYSSFPFLYLSPCWYDNSCLPFLSHHHQLSRNPANSSLRMRLQARSICLPAGTTARAVQLICPQVTDPWLIGHSVPAVLPPGCPHFRPTALSRAPLHSVWCAALSVWNVPHTLLCHHFVQAAQRLPSLEAFPGKPDWSSSPLPAPAPSLFLLLFMLSATMWY